MKLLDKLFKRHGNESREPGAPPAQPPQDARPGQEPLPDTGAPEEATLEYSPEEQAIIDRFLKLPRQCRRALERQVQKKTMANWEGMLEQIAVCETTKNPYHHR